jgi:apolipoprotein N-acyltransferase
MSFSGARILSYNRKVEFLINAGLLALAVVFFALPQPNPLSLKGFPFFAYIAFVPLFLLVRRVSFRASFLWGAFYGLFCYCLFSYWLGFFHPLAMYVIGALYFFWLLLVVPLLKLADLLFPKRGFIVQWMLWVGYEYLKTLGFNGYSYGIIGYSQWSWPVIIQIASIFGVWGVSALVVFPSAWIAGGLKAGCTGRLNGWASGFRLFMHEHAVSACLWCVAFFATVVFGLVSPRDYSAAPKVKVALIQPNSDPWMGGIDSYRRDFDTLTRLSDKALNADPDVKLVVWPETAFIPRIDWHYRYREDRESYELVSQLLTYLDKAPVPFVIGNDDAVQERTAEGILGRVDYNAVFLFKPGENVMPPNPDRYRKMHLVPFTEHFPYKKLFPWVYDVLVKNDTHFWEKGNDPVVFSASGLAFSTPICFEDTFGYLSRLFVRNGARVIVNLTNDAWAKNGPCQYQHLSMAVFRTVENRVPLVRSTASGQTCYVDPNGVVVSMAPPFSEAFLVVDIPVLSGYRTTLYGVWGDLWGVLFAAGAATMLIIGLLTKLRHLYDN